MRSDRTSSAALVAAADRAAAATVSRTVGRAPVAPGPPADGRPVIQVSGLSVDFHTAGGAKRILHGIDFSVSRGEVLGLVGESGCGKSVTALALAGLLDPSAEVNGQIAFEGRAVPRPRGRRRDREGFAALRGRGIGMIFQDPVGALNPVRTVGYQLREALSLHRPAGRREQDARAVDLLTQVGLPDPARRLRSYAHELSGGMAQRVMIALALAGRPSLLIADEPTTALDVTVQAQILRLLREVRRELASAMLLITHDFGVVAQTCDRVAVIYAGRVVETARTLDLFERPQHPYTKALLAAVPRLDRPQLERLDPVPGARLTEGPPVAGCVFALRCQNVQDTCRRIPPALKDRRDGHQVACHLVEEAA